MAVFWVVYLHYIRKNTINIFKIVLLPTLGCQWQKIAAKQKYCPCDTTFFKIMALMSGAYFVFPNFFNKKNGCCKKKVTI